MEVEGIEVNIQTITAITIEQMTTAFSSITLESGLSFSLLTEVSTLVRASSTFSMTMSTFILDVHLETVQVNMLAAWQETVTEASAIVIVRQDEAITITGLVLHCYSTVYYNSASFVDRHCQPKITLPVPLHIKHTGNAIMVKP